MKKIIIAAAIVCAAVFAEGAAVDWTASGILDAAATAAAGKNTAGSGWLGYMILASDYATVSADLAAGKTDSLLAKAVGPQKATTSKGQFTAGTASGSVAAGEQTFYLVVLNATTPSAATGFYSATATATVDASLDTLVAFGSQTAGTKAAANWQTVAAPEPTSGLLLLFGVAGLALRRRRA